MPLAIIPATVPATGPQFTTFPNEILIQIMKYLIFKTSRPVDFKYFTILNLRGCFGRLSNIDQQFATVVNQLFYTINTFNFKTVDTGNHHTVSRNYPAPMLPPSSVRHFLQNITITIVVTDSYLILNPDADNSVTTGNSHFKHAFVSVEQLMEHCAGARMLKSLTNALTGFSDLKVLNLHIKTNFRLAAKRQTVLAVYKEAGFSLRAEEINITAEDMAGMSLGWHPSLIECIRIE